MNEFMKAAIEEARSGIYKKEGGPFGSVVVKDGKIVGRGHNQVVCKKDPTCHGEMQAIRDACKTLDTFDLSGCVLFTTGEPCPMCLAACMWSNLDKVYFGCTIADNAEIGFRDEIFYKTLKITPAEGFLEGMEREACKQLFDEYKTLDKTAY